MIFRMAKPTRQYIVRKKRVDDQQTEQKSGYFRLLPMQRIVMDVPKTLPHFTIVGGAVVKWLARWTSDLKVGGSTPSPCHRVVSLTLSRQD